jgi:putative endonuclease
MRSHNYYVYITTNPKKTVLYTGVTNDLTRRMDEHLSNTSGDKKTFASRYFCYNLIYYEHYTDIRVAIAREKQIKGLSRKKKEELINFFNPDWRFLNSQVEIDKGDLPVWNLLNEDERPW